MECEMSDRVCFECGGSDGSFEPMIGDEQKRVHELFTECIRELKNKLAEVTTERDRQYAENVHRIKMQAAAEQRCESLEAHCLRLMEVTCQPGTCQTCDHKRAEVADVAAGGGDAS